MAAAPRDGGVLFLLGVFICGALAGLQPRWGLPYGWEALDLSLALPRVGIGVIAFFC